MSDQAGLGGVQLPLEAPDGTTIRATADPAKAELMALLRAAIEAELSDAWTVMREGTALSASPIVAELVPFDPQPFIARTTKLGFPLLGLSRTGASSNEWALGTTRRITDWTINYVLGELSVLEMGRLYDVLSAVEAVIVTTIEHGSHSAYEDGRSLMDAPAHLYRATITDSAYGHWAVAGEDGESVVYPSLQLTLRTEELESRQNSAEPFEGITIREDLGTSDPIEDFLIARVDYEAD